MGFHLISIDFLYFTMSVLFFIFQFPTSQPCKMVFRIAPKSVRGDMSRFGGGGGGVGIVCGKCCDNGAAVANGDIEVGTWERDDVGCNCPNTGIAVWLE